MFHYLTKSHPRVRPFAEKLQINPRPVEVSDYKIAFRDSAEGRRMLKEFNSSFDRKKFDSYVEEYLSKYRPLPEPSSAQ